MGHTSYRVTGIVLSLTVAALGAAATVLLYFAGNDIHERYKGQNDWFSGLMLNGWVFGLVFVVPGFFGSFASLVYKKSIMKIHVVVGIVCLIVGSFLHAGGGAAMVVFRVVTYNGIMNHDSWPSDCIYVRYDNDDNRVYAYEGICDVGRRAINNAIAAAIICLVAWIFLLCQLMYVAFTYHIIGKKLTKADIETTQPHNEDCQTSGMSTSCDNMDGQGPSPTPTTSTFSTVQKSKDTGATDLQEFTKADIEIKQLHNEHNQTSDMSTSYDNMDSQGPSPTQTTSTFRTVQKNLSDETDEVDKNYSNI